MYRYYEWLEVESVQRLFNGRSQGNDWPAGVSRREYGPYLGHPFQPVLVPDGTKFRWIQEDPENDAARSFWRRHLLNPNSIPSQDPSQQYGGFLPQSMPTPNQSYRIDGQSESMSLQYSLPAPKVEARRSMILVHLCFRHRNNSPQYPCITLLLPLTTRNTSFAGLSELINEAYTEDHNCLKEKIHQIQDCAHDLVGFTFRVRWAGSDVPDTLLKKEIDLYRAFSLMEEKRWRDCLVVECELENG